jgi:hypothetical protein
MDIDTIDDKKLALLVMSADGDDREEAVCILGRIDWDGRRLCAWIDHDLSFVVPLEKLEHVRPVPEGLRRDLGDADLYVTLQLVRGSAAASRLGRRALAVRWPD